MTSSTPLMSRPRAATSVATRMSNLAALNALRVTCTDRHNQLPHQCSVHHLALIVEQRSQGNKLMLNTNKEHRRYNISKEMG